MDIELVEGPAKDFEAYAGVSIAFPIERVLLPARDLSHLEFCEAPVETPGWKDYDREPGAHPALWPKRFDISDWWMVSAWHDGDRIGGAVLIQGVSEIDMLEGREDLALIWDLRVGLGARGRGVGRALVRAAEAWAASCGCGELKVETQNVNLNACKFYERVGFELRSAEHGAYPDLPDEIQMLWYKTIM